MSVGGSGEMDGVEAVGHGRPGRTALADRDRVRVR
ncbi:hypothetical protein FHS44_006536 [Streptosporangium saharense]|uniref:Uncharacterized protein n=1 Tax=Streptosporangium saharense TaxID=1706840 RepID=A0A7W7VRB4_9ACTN|nr:hypothetical protein [Streptosporangium saharense]